MNDLLNVSVKKKKRCLKMFVEIHLVLFVLHPAKVVDIPPQVKTYLQILKFVFTCESMKKMRWL